MSKFVVLFKMTSVSFWEKESWLQYDMAVVGGGIVGLNVASQWLETHPNGRVLVLERGILPTGASTRNAGFACFGSLSELVCDIQTMGEEKALQLVSRRLKGLHKLKQRIGEKAMQFKLTGGYEVLEEKHLHYTQHLEKVNSLLAPLFDSTVFKPYKQGILEFGLNPGTYHNMICCPYEGQINTGETMRSLLQHVQKLGGVVLTGAEVTNITDNGKINIQVNDTTRQNTLEITASKAIICTNAFTKTIIPDADVTPGRGQVVITTPLPKIPFEGIFHLDEGFYYFRNIGNRVLLGGGRNMDFETETTFEMTTTDTIIGKLTKMLQEDILPGSIFKVEASWAGTMAFGKEKLPVVDRVSNNIAAAYRSNGMGVSLAAQLAEEVVAMIKL